MKTLIEQGLTFQARRNFVNILPLTLFPKPTYPTRFCTYQASSITWDHLLNYTPSPDLFLFLWQTLITTINVWLSSLVTPLGEEWFCQEPYVWVWLVDTPRGWLGGYFRPPQFPSATQTWNPRVCLPSKNSLRTVFRENQGGCLWRTRQADTNWEALKH